jgi:hypothetical protein
MRSHKTPLERAQRRVLEAQAQIARQTAAIADLQERGLDTTEAKAFLAAFTDLLHFAQEDVAYFRDRVAREQS